MKVVLWSPVSGQACTTGNTLALAIMSVLFYQKRVIVAHTHFSDYSLERSILGNSTVTELFENIGIDSLSRNIKTEELSGETINNCSISLINDRLKLIPGTIKKNKELFEMDLLKTITPMVHSLEWGNDLVFIDTQSGDNVISRKVMEEADITIINLGQNKQLIDEYLLNFNLPRENAMFIIGNYNCESRYNLRNLEKIYPFLKNKTVAFPYSVEYFDAMAEGKTIPYFMKHLMNRGNNRDYIKGVEKAVGLLLKTSDTINRTQRKKEGVSVCQ